MGNIESEEEETLPELKSMKFIVNKGTYKVYQNLQNNKFYDFWFQKSSDHNFEEEMEIANRIKKENLSGVAQIHTIQRNSKETLFKKYYCLNLLTEHPTYTLKDYIQKKAKNKCLTPDQITDLFVAITNAQYMLGSKKQYLGFDNIYTDDGRIWKIKPFLKTISFYQELLQHKSKNLDSFEMSGFPSPEEFHQINCDIDRVQIFGLGMLLLELITKKKSKDIYQRYTIDEALLQERINSLQGEKQKYRGRLIEFVTDTLDLDLVRRPNYRQLSTFLNSPESNINSEFINQQVQPIDQNKPVNYSSFNPSESQISEANIDFQYSRVEQLLNSKINDHRIKNSYKPKQNQSNQTDYNYYGLRRNGLYHGQAKLFTKTNMLIYEGEFCDGKYHNFGTLKYFDTIQLKENFNYKDCTNIEKYAVSYEGSFQHDIKHGEGRLTLTNGEVFVGQFVNGVIDGYGSFQPNNQQKVIGIWKDGIFQSNSSILQSFDNLNVRASENFNKSEIKGRQQLESQELFNSQNQMNSSDINDNNLPKLYYDDQKTLIKYVGEMNQGKMSGQGKLFFMDGKLKIYWRL
ncbi:unnamed protein product (macronuclear) [Paramecium tetraurelia]|uniref:Protein kinase domain-containing protein n=1 Tax=Paramecium tetraurelia TaxID=5888 RepID=A0D4T9_PARTE|nr:uncharacterized protein GSPATT00013503001 [Paramecium tetraurelia]CAK78056.1 unnamed protein product [Paramecium tetraurelia]|eukprot:XP_001445453.1 hypothetical protein (macronuclear) [Paramecium tetraurelia strain d4-2]